MPPETPTTRLARRPLILGPLILGLALAAAGCAPLPRSNPLSAEAVRNLTLAEIVVTTDGATFEGAGAERSSRLAPELQAVLRREFTDRTGPSSTTMVVEVARLNVAGGASTALGRDQSALSGTVRLIDGGRLIASYPIQVVAGEASESVAGTVVGAAVNRSERFYRRLLRGFAQDAREQIVGRGLPGSRAVRRVTGG